MESTGLGLVSFFLCGVACPAVALSLVRTSTARLVYVTPSGSGNWGVVFGGWAAWTAAVPLWRSAVRAPNLTALGEKGGQCLVAASPVRLHGVREEPVYVLRGHVTVMRAWAGCRLPVTLCGWDLGMVLRSSSQTSTTLMSATYTCVRVWTATSRGAWSTWRRPGSRSYMMKVVCAPRLPW